MRKLIVCSAVLLSSISFAGQANTLITPENLDRLQASLVALQAFDKQLPEKNKSQSEMKLEQHCNWQKHYQALIKDEFVTPEHVREYENLLQQHGFRSGGEHLELSMKTMLPSFNAWEEHLKQHNITPDANSELGKSLLQMQQLKQVVSSCLTSADKTALQRYEARIAELALKMAEHDDTHDGFDHNDDGQY